MLFHEPMSSGFQGWAGLIAGTVFASVSCVIVTGRAWMPTVVWYSVAVYLAAEVAFVSIYLWHARRLNKPGAFNVRPSNAGHGQAGALTHLDPGPAGHDAASFLAYVKQQVEFYFRAFGSRMDATSRAQVYLGPW